MKQDSRKKRLAVGLAVLGLLTVLLVLRPTATLENHDDGAADPVVDIENTSGEAGTEFSSRRMPRRPGMDSATKDTEAVDFLREQFGETITNKRSQIKALEKLISYLMKTYPDDWEARLQEFLELAFPGMGDQLLAQYENMTAYNEWLNSSRADLAEMSPAEKRDAMREARFRFFGEDAAEIWEEAIRHEQIYDAMDEINQSPDSSVEEKFTSYLDAINESYGDKAPQFIENRQTELLTNFLALPAVQDDLRALTPEQRQGQLTDIRRGMGMDDEALQRWRQLDQQRDQGWETGERYMDARAQLEKTLQGEQLAKQLQALQESTFGTDAVTIQSEEASGFFRFGHPRVYGKE